MNYKNILDIVGRINVDYVLLEGRRLLIDAINRNMKPFYIFYTSLHKPLGSQMFNCETFLISKKTMNKLTNTVTAPGIVGFFERPIMFNSPSIPLSVVCNRIRDPGNLGTLIRTMAAFSCEQALFINCADAWSSKVVRSAAGGHFRIPLHPIKDINELSQLISVPDTTLVMADILKDDSSSQIQRPIHFRELATLFDTCVDTKMDNNFNDHRTNNNNHIKHEKNEFGKIHENAKQSNNNQLPKIALMLGNESWGFENFSQNDDARNTIISGNDIKNLQTSLNSQQIVSLPWKNVVSTYIPMERQTDSLNVSVAGAILLFTLKTYYDKILQKPHTCYGSS